MMKSEVIIDERRCNGCGYCVEFCKGHCLKRGLDRISPLGYALPALARPEKCTACGFCAQICPRWAIEVNRYSGDEGRTVAGKGIAGLTLDAPLSGCPGCQHPTMGRIVAEVIAEMGLSNTTVGIESIPCSTSSAFGMDFGRKLAYDEIACDVATEVKRASPDAPVVAVQGYWGLSDFSFHVGALIGALIRGEKFTLILCNMPFYGPKEGRPAPINESIEGRLEPATRINTSEGQKLMVGGSPLHLAELVATFEGVAYSARGAITSVKDYRLTKSYVRKALRKQMDNSGFSFVEILAVCSDSSYSPPKESLQWVKDKMAAVFPLGEFKETTGSHALERRSQKSL